MAEPAGAPQGPITAREVSTRCLDAGWSALLRWHISSLDAPSVAVVWALTLARLGGTRVRPADLLVLALGTWIVYVADRLLDVRGSSGSLAAWRTRHHFHARHRRVLVRLCWCAAGLLSTLCAGASGGLVRGYLLLGLPVALYGLWVHAPRKAERGSGKRTQIRGLWKEAAVGILFSAAVGMPAWTTSSIEAKPRLLVAAALLAWLCWLNCALISYAEGGRQCGGPGPLGWGAAALAVAALGCDLAGEGGGQQYLPAGWIVEAVGVSSLLLLGLLWGGAWLRAERVRVLADLALLTPLPWLLLSR